MNKKILCLFTIFLVGTVAIAEGQQPKKIARLADARFQTRGRALSSKSE